MADTVNIACKLPNGLQITVDGKTVVLNGANDAGAKFGFGITPDVDADFYKKWAESVGKFPAVKNGSIFAYSGDIANAARERASDPAVMTGQEPLNAEAPMAGIEPTDETKKELAKAAAPAKGK